MNGLQRCLRWINLLSVASVLATGAASFAAVQESPPPTPPAATANPPSAGNAGKKYSHADDFLIRGTVFTEKGLSFPGVELRIRIAGQKKYRWEASTNSRGEFAVRVPQGSDYEMLVRVKGFTDQTKVIDAKTGENEGTVSFRMQQVGGSKK